MACVSGRSITWFNRVNPKPLITNLCFTGAQIAERTHFNWTFPLPAFDFFAVISKPQWSMANDQRPESFLQYWPLIPDHWPLALKALARLSRAESRRSLDSSIASTHRKSL